MIRSVSVVAASFTMVMAGTVTPLAAQPGVKAPPNACKTFTVPSVDKLFGVKASTKPKETMKSEEKGTPEADSICTVTAGKHSLVVSASLLTGGFGGPFKVYSRPKLGTGGEVAVSTMKNFKTTLARYERKKIFFNDNDNAILPKKGKALYKFALAQSKAFAKGK